MKTLSKRLKKEQAYSKRLEKEAEEAKRNLALAEHLIEQQLHIEQRLRNELNKMRMTVDETQKYMIYMAKLALEKNKELLIELKDIHDITQEDIDIQVYEGETGKIEKMKMKLI